MPTVNFEKVGINVPYGKHGRFKMVCPFCNETRTNKGDKSLSVDTERGAYKCHHCGKAGYALDYTEDEKKEWMKTQAWYHSSAKTNTPKKAYTKPKATGKAELSEKLIAYFASRGISKATLEAFKVTEGVEWMPEGRMKADGSRRPSGKINTVQFNYYVKGELRNTKFRSGDKVFRFVKDAELLPYNIDGILVEKECIIVEGEIDALSFAEAGRTDVVSVPNGGSSNSAFLDDYLEEYFDDKETIYIATDTDEVGIKMRDELLRRFGADRCRIVSFGEGCKDANEHLVKFGKESLLQCIANAPEMKLEGVFTVDDFRPELDNLYVNGLQKGATIGHRVFDELISFETRRLCVVTGIPGSGKSEFVYEMVARLNLRYGWKAALFTPENMPFVYPISSFVQKLTGRRYKQGLLSDYERTQAEEFVNENFYFVEPNDDFKLDSVLAVFKSLVRRKGVKVVVIDPFNRLDDEAEADANGSARIGILIKQIANFAKKNDVLAIVVAHPRKLNKNKDGQYDAPTLYDISGSANFYNMTDFGLTVHRIDGFVDIHIQKVKFRHLGNRGVARFGFDINNGRYITVANGLQDTPDLSNWIVEKARETRRNSEQPLIFRELQAEFDNHQPKETHETPTIYRKNQDNPDYFSDIDYSQIADIDWDSDCPF